MTTMADIAARTAAHHKLRDIRENTRRPEVSHPRQEAYAAMLDAGFTSYQIGGWFGRDHSTIVEGAQAHRKRTKP